VGKKVISELAVRMAQKEPYFFYFQAVKEGK
jgi:hypothetical protein